MENKEKKAVLKKMIKEKSDGKGGAASSFVGTGAFDRKTVLPTIK